MLKPVIINNQINKKNGFLKGKINFYCKKGQLKKNQIFQIEQLINNHKLNKIKYHKMKAKI